MTESPIMRKALLGEKMEDVFIFDAHGHLDYWKPAMNHRTGSVAIIDAMDRLGVDMVCINKWNCPDIYAANDDVAAAVKKHTGRFVGFAATAPCLGREKNLAELRRCFDELGLKGVKVHNAYETLPFRDTMGMRKGIDALEAVWEFCDERRCPVLCHGFLTPAYAAAYPNAIFIAAHAGGCRHYTDIYKDLPNVYFDTAASMTLSGNIKHFVDMGMEDRVLYGSDLPYASQGYRFGQVVSAVVPERAMRKILGENLARILKMEIPAGYRAGAV